MHYNLYGCNTEYFEEEKGSKKMIADLLAFISSIFVLVPNLVLLFKVTIGH